MNSSLPHPPPDRPLEHRFADLLGMGFERVDPGPTTTESIRLRDGTYKLTQIRPAMGSFAAITALHRSPALAEHAVGTAFDEMARLTGLLNRFDSASALSYLNETGRIIAPPPELDEIVERSLAFAALTGGAFDITVKPVIDLFRDPVTYAPRSAPPDKTDLRGALELVGAHRVRVSAGDICLARTGMGLTLDGIAKGYVVDGIAASLQRSGVSSFLINAGGDIRVSGNASDGVPWTVAVRDPGSDAPSWDADAWDSCVHADKIQLAGGAVATSGSYEVYFDRERRAHHIVQASTGRSPRRAASVTVTAPDTVAADALATAVFVLGPERGRSLIEGVDQCECLVIDRQGKRTCSSGWPASGAASSGWPASGAASSGWPASGAATSEQT